MSSVKTWLLIILLITFLIYLPLTQAYFQLDELAVLGRTLSSQDSNLIDILKLSFRPTVAHFVPFHQFFVQVYIELFKMNYVYYALASIFGHLAVVVISFKLFAKLFKQKYLAVLATAIFAFSASGHQATSWPLSDISIHGAAIFGLLSLIAVLNKNILRSLVFLLIALLFKEVVLGLFLLLPLAYFIYFPKEKNKVRIFTIFVISGAVYVLSRLLMFFAPRGGVQEKLVTQDQSFAELISNLFTFPVKVVSQTLIPPRQLLFISRKLGRLLPEGISGLYGTTQFDLFVEDNILLLLGLLIFGLVLWFTIRYRNNKAVLFGFLFVVFNSFVYVLSPDRSGRIPVIDSRNLYFPIVGAAILFVALLYEFTKKNINKTLIIVFVFIVMNIFWLNREVSVVARAGIVRREILEQIKSDYPSLPQRIIFYTASDTSFYGLPEDEKILPFQTNFGSNLFVWYLPTETFSPKMLENGWFLYGVTDEGYKEFDSRGFGYFRDLENLKKAVEENKLPIESIIAYRYDSFAERLYDTTEEVRAQVSDDL